MLNASTLLAYTLMGPSADRMGLPSAHTAHMTTVFEIFDVNRSSPAVLNFFSFIQDASLSFLDFLPLYSPLPDPLIFCDARFPNRPRVCIIHRPPCPAAAASTASVRSSSMRRRGGYFADRHASRLWAAGRGGADPIRPSVNLGGGTPRFGGL